MDPLKIVVPGPVCAGKTTFIRPLPEEEMVSTEQRTIDATEKDTTTVGLELGRVTVQGRATRLFGTPGQQRFDYLWDILAEGADACAPLPGGSAHDVGPVLGVRSGACPGGRRTTGCGHHTGRPHSVGAHEFRDRFAPAGIGTTNLDSRNHRDCRALLADLVVRIGT